MALKGDVTKKRKADDTEGKHAEDKGNGTKGQNTEGGSHGKDTEETEAKGTEPTDAQGAERNAGKGSEGKEAKPKKPRTTASKSAAKKRVKGDDNAADAENGENQNQETEQAEEAKVDPPKKKRRASSKTERQEALPKAKAKAKATPKGKAKATAKGKAKATAKGVAKPKAKASSSGRRQFVSMDEVDATGPSAEVLGDPFRQAVTKEVLACLHACNDCDTLYGKGRHHHDHETWSGNDKVVQLSAYWSRKCVGIKAMVEQKWSQVAYFSRPTPCTATNLILAKYWVRVSFATFCYQHQWTTGFLMNITLKMASWVF